MLGLVQSAILAVQNCRPLKFQEVCSRQNDLNRTGVIFNEATTAGVLDSLKGCTRLLMTEEGDVILKRMGAFLLPFVGGRESAALDDFRAQLINLYDHPKYYSKRLKNSIVEAGLTGELVQRVIIRRGQNTLADALFERFVFWILAGDAIDTEVIRPSWNYSCWPSVEQFAVIMSLFEQIEMYFDEDANLKMIHWCNYIKRQGVAEEHDDHLASRLGKSVDAVHRIAGLCQIIESSWTLVEAFIENYGCFEEHSISNEFFDKCSSLFFDLYSSCVQDNRRFRISLDVVERSTDIISGNLEQYKLLMFIPENEIVNTVTKSNNSIDTVIMNVVDKKAKRILKFSKKSTEMEKAVLLFNSVLFTLTTLYECRLLKNGAAVLRNVCDGLVDKKLLIRVDRGTGTGTKAVAIYIKAVPNTSSDIECQRFINNLASLGNPYLTMQAVLDSSKTIKFLCKKPPIESVFKILAQPQYKALQLNLTPLCHGVDNQDVETAISDSNGDREFSSDHDHDILVNSSLPDCASSSGIISQSDDLIETVGGDGDCSTAVGEGSDYSTAASRGGDYSSALGGGDDNRIEVDEQVLFTSGCLMADKFITVNTSMELDAENPIILSEQNIAIGQEYDLDHEVQMNLSPSIEVPFVSSDSQTVEKRQTTRGYENQCEGAQNESSDVEFPVARRRQPRTRLKRLKKADMNGEGLEKTVQASQSHHLNAIQNGSNQSNFSTPIAGRLCRTRLPRARF